MLGLRSVGEFPPASAGLVSSLVLVVVAGVEGGAGEVEVEGEEWVPGAEIVGGMRGIGGLLKEGFYGWSRFGV